MTKAKILKEFKKLRLPKFYKLGVRGITIEKWYDKGWIDCHEYLNRFLSPALDKAREEGWQAGYQQCKEDKEGLK